MNNYLHREMQSGFNRYIKLLPVKELETLGEGDTPVVFLTSLAEEIGIKSFSAKNEGMNPTASFKDRAMAVAFSRAREIRAGEAVVASAGNASSSAAAYGALYGIPVYAVVPASTSLAKVAQAIVYGAKIVLVDGGYSDSFMIVKNYGEKYGGFNVSTTYINPYVVAGYKTMAYEIAGQCEKLPDVIMIPVGAGPLLAGLYEGFNDFLKMGLINKIPKLVAIQSDRCCPIVRAFNEEKPVREWTMTEATIASGMNDELRGYPEDGDRTLSYIRLSEGAAVAVSEQEIINSVHRLGRQGIYAEPASASGIAATAKLKRQGWISNEASVMMIVTGNGLKNPLPTIDLPEIRITSDEQLRQVICNFEINM